MVDNDYIYAVYANKDLAPPSSDYWAERRRVASLMRSLQEEIQTTALPLADLARLGDALQGRRVYPKRRQWKVAVPGLSIWFDNDAAHAAVTFGWMYEGADNIAHGGWVAAVFDEFLFVEQRKMKVGGEMWAGDTLVASCEAVFICKGQSSKV